MHQFCPTSKVSVMHETYVFVKTSRALSLTLYTKVRARSAKIIIHIVLKVSTKYCGVHG